MFNLFNTNTNTKQSKTLQKLTEINTGLLDDLDTLSKDDRADVDSLLESILDSSLAQRIEEAAYLA